MEEMLGVGIRVSVAYAYVLAMLRLSGKRSVGALSPFDLMIALVIGDMFDDLFWGDIPLSIWLVGLSTIMLLEILVSYGAFRSKRLGRIVGSRRAILVRHGTPDRREMARERVGDEELAEELRLHGLEDPEQVREMALEPSGQASLLKEPEFEPAQKRDLPGLGRAA